MKNDSTIQPDHLADSVSQAHDNESERQHQNLLALSRVSAAVSGLGNLNAILEVALDNVLSIMNGSVGGILLLDEKSQTLSYQVYRGLPAKYAEEMKQPIKLGEGLTGKVAQSGKSILLEDISAEPHIRHDLMYAENLRAVISVPLRAKDAVLGVINVASHTPRQFTNTDMYLLNSIGDQVGIAIEHAKLEEQLREGRELYRQLARQTLIRREDERRRLARELHDETSQAISGLSFTLRALLEMSEASSTIDEEFKTRLKKALSLTTNIGTEVGRIMRELHPVLLDTLGVVPAVRQYAEANLIPLGIKVSVESKGSFDSLPREVELGVFRIAQGAISNIAKHSQAKNAVVSMEGKTNELLLLISDDGKGFEISEIKGIEQSGRGRGVFTMKERVRLLGGTGSVTSQPGKGTTVTASIPIIRSIADAEDKSISS